MNPENSIIKFEPSVLCDITRDGRYIYNTNAFMRSLTNIMENSEFSDVFDKYFDSWDNIELFVMFAKVYQSIKKQFPEMSGYEKIALVKKIIDNSKSRQLVCREIRNFKNINRIT